VEVAMLAEIYFLRIETLVRASEGAARAQDPRFVPLQPDTLKDVRAKVPGQIG
jgi:AMMECR1 domain-containing protein